MCLVFLQGGVRRTKRYHTDRSGSNVKSPGAQFRPNPRFADAAVGEAPNFAFARMRFIRALGSFVRTTDHLSSWWRDTPRCPRQLEKETRAGRRVQPVAGLGGARGNPKSLGIGYTCPIYGVYYKRSGPPPDPDSRYSYIGPSCGAERRISLSATFAVSLRFDERRLVFVLYSCLREEKEREKKYREREESVRTYISPGCHDIIRTSPEVAWGVRFLVVDWRRRSCPIPPDNNPRISIRRLGNLWQHTCMFH